MFEIIRWNVDMSRIAAMHCWSMIYNSQFLGTLQLARFNHFTQMYQKTRGITLLSQKNYNPCWFAYTLRPVHTESQFLGRKKLHNKIFYVLMHTNSETVALWLWIRKKRFVLIFYFFRTAKLVTIQYILDLSQHVEVSSTQQRSLTGKLMKKQEPFYKAI